ncbi:heterokaryon incompatibility (het-6OR allele) [Fusarium sp. NRRL 52700]|nr:heterokaryon incompatibility (het-6OR allele) [Fusarium sp. NRRL 52700]
MADDSLIHVDGPGPFDCETSYIAVRPQIITGSKEDPAEVTSHEPTHCDTRLIQFTNDGLVRYACCKDGIAVFATQDQESSVLQPGEPGDSMQKPIQRSQADDHIVDRKETEIDEAEDGDEDEDLGDDDEFYEEGDDDYDDEDSDYDEDDEEGEEYDNSDDDTDYEDVDEEESLDPEGGQRPGEEQDIAKDIIALCINKQDSHERASHVALMGEIYSHARYVLAFLSPQSEPFELELDYIEATAHDTSVHFDLSISPHLTVRGLNASEKPLQDSLIAFFATPWWTRVCTVQEFLLARKVIFRCGGRLIDFEIVRKAYRAWIDHENSFYWATRRPIDGSAHGFLDIPSEINSGLTIYTATLRMKYLMDMLVPGNLYTEDFLAAISLFRVRHCSGPQARGFGYFGLRSPDLDVKSGIPFDYNVSIADLYKNLAVTLIHKSQTLDVLSHVLYEPGITKRTDGLPSWAPH